MATQIVMDQTGDSRHQFDPKLPGVRRNDKMAAPTKS